MEFETFDAEAVYDEKIKPLVEQLIAVCDEHKIAWIASFIYGIEEDGEEGVVVHGVTGGAGFPGRYTNELIWARNLLKHGKQSAESQILNAYCNALDAKQQQVLASTAGNH